MKVFIFFIFISIQPISAQRTDTLQVFNNKDSLSTPSNPLHGLAQSDSAIVHAIFVIDDVRKKFGNDHLKVAEWEEYAGELYIGSRQWDEAEKHYKEALRIKKLHFDHISTDVAKVLMNLGNVYWGKEDYITAAGYYEESRDILSITEGEDNLGVGWAWHNLGAISLLYGDIQTAEVYLQHALEIKTKQLGPDDEDVARTLNYLGYTYSLLGKQELAEEYILKSAIITMDHYGPDQLAYYYAKNNLVPLHIRRGEKSLAIDAAKTAILGKEKILGNTHHDVGNSWDWLGNAYQQFGEYDSAQIAYEKALTIYERSDTFQLNGWAIVLNNIGINAIYLKKYDEAIYYLKKSLAMKKKYAGSENIDYYLTAIALGEALIYVMHYDSAFNLLNEARTYYEKSNLRYHDGYSHCLMLLSKLDILLERGDEALVYMQRLSAINKEIILNLTQFGSERELTLAIRRTESLLYQRLSMTNLFGVATPDYIKEVCNDILFYKGFVLNTTAQLRNLIKKDVGSQRSYTLLNEYKALLLNEYLKPQEDRSKITGLQFNIDSIEKILIKSNLKYADFQRQPKWEDFQSTLKQGEYIVDFIHYPYYTPGLTDSVFYAAMLLGHDMKSPRLVILFEESELDSLLNNDQIKYLDLHAQNATAYFNDDSLYNLIWSPIIPYMPNCKRIFYIPSGSLHQLNLSALPGKKSSYLADSQELIHLNNSRELLDNHHVTVTAHQVVLFGGMEYDLDTLSYGSIEKSENPHNISNTPDMEWFGSKESIEKIRGLKWGYLAGSKKEIDSIEIVLSSTDIAYSIFEGDTGTEEVCKTICCAQPPKESPWVIHFSTHGYFFQNASPILPNQFIPKGESVFRYSDHPMIRSGLILAGGNYAWKHGHPYKPGMEDGILTAYEISQMDLSNTELVVLSACETGLGDIEGNEGVYGLQRAFKIAGVKNLIMSLWKVPDAATAELMISFYKHWLEDKMTIRQSLYAAQKELRDEGFEPFYWAGWVLVE